MALERHNNNNHNTINLIITNINFYEIPVNCLSSNTKRLLSNGLNKRKIIPNENGLLRDWRGLSKLIKLDRDIINNLNTISDPTSKIIELWDNKNVNVCNLGELQRMIGALDRWDVVDDTNQNFFDDAKLYLEQEHRKQYNVTVTPSNDSLSSNDNSTHLDEDRFECITDHDVERAKLRLPPQTYDAFVLFADQDYDFYEEVRKRLVEDYHLKICTKENLLFGITFEHAAVLRLIGQRCNRLLIFITPDFLRSRYNQFFIKFAQALSIEQKRRIIIPVLLKPCEELPILLHYFFLLDYKRYQAVGNFWDKLNISLTRIPDVDDVSLNRRLAIAEIPNSQILMPQIRTLPEIMVNDKAIEYQEKERPTPMPRNKRDTRRSLSNNSNKINTSELNSSENRVQIMPPKGRLRSISASTSNLYVDSTMSSVKPLQHEQIISNGTTMTQSTTNLNKNDKKWFNKLLTKINKKSTSKQQQLPSTASSTTALDDLGKNYEKSNKKSKLMFRKRSEKKLALAT